MLSFFALFANAGRGAPSPVGTLVGVDGKWHYLNSEHFEIYSHQSDDEARDLLHNLEILRAVFFNQLKLTERLHVDVTIYAFRSRKEFLAYAPQMLQDQSQLGGFHEFQEDRSVIVLPPTEGTEEARQTIFHEYVHHLFRIAEQDPPLWFNEGTADVLAGMRVQRDRVYIGTPFVGRVAYLQTQRLLPLAQLLAADQSSKVYFEEQHTGVFYAESWALVHYLHFGETDFPKAAVDRFLSVALDREKLGRVNLEAHFRACFGFGYEEMETKLHRYIMSGSYVASRVPMPPLPAKDTYPVRPVPVEEAKLRLAELSVRVLQSGAGELALLNAIGEPRPDPRAFETLGAEALMKGDERGAEERWSQAMEAGTKNPAIVRELALIEGHRWFRSFNPYLILPDDVTARLRERLQRSIAIEPNQGASYEMLMWVEAFSREPNKNSIQLIANKIASIRDRRRTMIALCHFNIRSHSFADADAVLSYLEHTHLERTDEDAQEKLHEELDRVRSDVQTSAEAPAPEGAPIAIEQKDEATLPSTGP